MSHERADFYSDPEVYDVLHAPDTRTDVAGLERIFKRFVVRWRSKPSKPARAASYSWLEPACGTGRLLRIAAERGYRAIGFDRERHMIAYARRKARETTSQGSTRFFVSEMNSFASHLTPATIDFAFNPINTFRHIRTDREALQHFREIDRVLRADGVYAVGLSVCAYGFEPDTEDVWIGRARGMEVTQVAQYLPPPYQPDLAPKASREERVISHMTITTGRDKARTEKHVDSTYTLRGYNLKQWLDLIKKSPFKVIGIVDQTGRDTDVTEPGYAVWVLGKKSSS
jgi:SAM-dependent methyltransferase